MSTGLYLTLKWLPVASASIAFGSNVTHFFWLMSANGDPPNRANILRVVKKIDDRLAVPAYILAIACGAALWLAQWPVNTSWILASLVLSILLAATGVTYGPFMKQWIRLAADQRPGIGISTYGPAAAMGYKCALARLCTVAGKPVQVRQPDDAADGDKFVRIGARDNFYQSCSFIPMSFALVTTLHEDGTTGIGPHALCFPFNITEPYAMMLISRGSSATAGNLRRTGRCALNYIEFDEERLHAVARLGYPGQSAEDKLRASPFTLIPSPLGAGDASYPRIISEAIQVFECSWDRSMNLSMTPDSATPNQEQKFVLRIGNILLKRRYRDGVEEGRHFPSLPLFYGFRAGGEFWFARHQEPLAIAPPKVAGNELQSVAFIANRLDEKVRFTDDACSMLTGVPRPFLQGALETIIGAARERGIVLVDRDFLDDINRKRDSRQAQ